MQGNDAERISNFKKLDVLAYSVMGIWTTLAVVCVVMMAVGKA